LNGDYFSTNARNEMRSPVCQEISEDNRARRKKRVACPPSEGIFRSCQLPFLFEPK